MRFLSHGVGQLSHGVKAISLQGLPRFNEGKTSSPASRTRVEGWASQLKDQWNLATMTGVRLGGIDPSILRELSGVYKPFPKALKELVSNAFDADADRVQVTIGDDFSSVTVTDDGEGMTPFEFRNDFTRIGGGSRRWLGERTRKGRPRSEAKASAFSRLPAIVAVWRLSRPALGRFNARSRSRKHRRQSSWTMLSGLLSPNHYLDSA
jgi:hypothetical protein